MGAEEGTLSKEELLGWRSLSSEREGESDARRRFSAINFGAFMQRRFSRINEKGKRERNMDGLSHFKHVAIVALVTLQLILKREKARIHVTGGAERKEGEDYRGEKGIGIASQKIRCQPVHRLHICCRSEKWHRNGAAPRVALVFDFQRPSIHT